MKMEELRKNIELLESKVESLTQKINEVIACLEDNEIYRKVSVDYVYSGEEETENSNDKPEE